MLVFLFFANIAFLHNSVLGAPSIAKSNIDITFNSLWNSVKIAYNKVANTVVNIYNQAKETLSQAGNSLNQVLKKGN